MDNVMTPCTVRLDDTNTALLRLVMPLTVMPCDVFKLPPIAIEPAVSTPCTFRLLDMVTALLKLAMP